MENIPQQIKDRFDIIGFDPRGTGDSKQTYSSKFERLNTVTNYGCRISTNRLSQKFIRTKSEIDALSELVKKASASCYQEIGDDVRYTGSMNVIRDMNQMRKAFGEDKINYLGYSYGTRLGALFVQEYPQHARAFILDASMDPTKNLYQMTIDEAYQNMNISPPRGRKNVPNTKSKIAQVLMNFWRE